MNKFYPVYTLNNECHDCYKCVRECPVKAIKIENGHASVIDDKCIACGSCVKACPSEAKRVRNDIEKVKNLLRAKKEVYVSLAPSWRGVFNISNSKMISLLKSFGFSGVSETALGAQEVSIKTAQMINSSDKGLFISSACPVIVDYIQFYSPEFVDCITPIASPALMHAKLLKEAYGERVSVVFIGPCIAKKNEADRYPELIDVALTFEEFKIWLGDERINLSDIYDNNTELFIPENAYEGALYPVEGGMNETIKKVGVKEGVQLMSISSIPAFQNALKNLDVDKIDKNIFVEALACYGGCVCGPCIASESKPGISVISDILCAVQQREVVPKNSVVMLDMAYGPKPHADRDYPLEEILKALKKIGKHSQDDELNCGGCGYSTCRELAKALIAKEAESSMCVSYMRKIAMRKAAAMLRCMPSAIVMIDNEFRIVEANNSFMKMFCGDMYDVFSSRPDGLAGAAIDRIVNFGDLFKTALKSGKDIHKERYPLNNKLYDISAFTIERNEIVGAIISDVTKIEMNREKIAQKAQEVISKNISIVQDIACLLGEHVVETELLLSSIAQDFDAKDGGA